MRFSLCLIVVLFSFLNLQASETLRVYNDQLEFQRVFEENKSTYLKCADRSTIKQNESENLNQNKIGCVESFDFFKSICDKRQTINYERRNPQIKPKFYSEACDLTERAQTLMIGFIDIDSKSCRKGFTSLPERLKLIQEKQNEMPDGVAFRYEMKSCKQIKTYVNLCTYIDGELRKIKSPPQNQLLPDTDLNNSKLASCSNNEKQLSSIYNFNEEIKKRSQNIQSPILSDIISEYRSRTPAGEKNSDCESVRAIFTNLKCEKFENISEEEPIYYSQEDWDKMRRKKQELIKAINRGENTNRQNGSGN